MLQVSEDGGEGGCDSLSLSLSLSLSKLELGTASALCQGLVYFDICGMVMGIPKAIEMIWSISIGGLEICYP